MNFRLATFNCENLFSRPALLNFDDNRRARKPLEQLVKLDQLIAKPKYTASDKEKMLKLVDKLKHFIALNELRDKLICTNAGQPIVRPCGRADWVGGIVLKRDPVPTEAQSNTAKVIEAVNADVQCLVEVEDRLTVEQFSNTFFTGNASYPYNAVFDGNDTRGIDVGLLSRFEIRTIKTHIFDPGGAIKGKRTFSRDCLEVQVALPNGKPLFLLINHFKSQGYGTQKYNDAKRKSQADRVAQILSAYDLTKDFVAVLGDFNDQPHSAPLKRLLKMRNLVDVIAQQIPVVGDRWTYHDKSQIDYLLVSKALAAKLKKAGIERRGLFQADKLTETLSTGVVQPFDTVTSDANDASDHAAVWAEFGI
jgi:endonuclease/exonuclease/phosphatase family metal-dependent hydrolase